MLEYVHVSRVVFVQATQEREPEESYPFYDLPLGDTKHHLSIFCPLEESH